MVRLCLPRKWTKTDTSHMCNLWRHESWVCYQSLWWWNKWKQIQIRRLLELSSVIFFLFSREALTWRWLRRGTALMPPIQWLCWSWLLQHSTPFNPIEPQSTHSPKILTNHHCRARLPVGFWWSMAPWMTLSSDPFWRWRVLEDGKTRVMAQTLGLPIHRYTVITYITVIYIYICI